MPTQLSPRPSACSVAFKEWLGICQALGSGAQSLILRKGGIEESSGEFRPEHPRFWLYPTHLHEGEQGLKPGTIGPDATIPAGTVPITLLASVESIRRVDDLDRLLDLDPLHAWTEETVRKRFAYRSPGLWVLGLRVYRKSSPAWVEVTPEQMGCKTWVPLETAIEADDLVPVLDDRGAVEALARIASTLDRGPAS